MSAIEKGLREALEKLKKDLSTTNTAHASDLKKAELWAELLHEKKKISDSCEDRGRKREAKH